MLLVAFFSIGFNHKYIYGPALGLTLLFIIYDIFSKRMVLRWKVLGYYSLLCCFLALVYQSPYLKVLGAKKIFIKQLAAATLSLYPLSLKSLENRKLTYKYLISYILGFSLDMLIYVLYNLFVEAGARGKIYVPFSKKVENSPRLANSIAFCSSFFLPFFLKVKRSPVRIVFISFMIIVFTYFGVYLKARSYFVLLMLSLVLIPFVFDVSKVKKYWAIITGVVITIFLGFSIYLESGKELISRFNKLGIARYLLFKDGFTHLLKNPSGGFSPSLEVGKLSWFHNIFLDTARLSGVIGLLILILVHFLSIYFVYKNLKRRFNELIILWAMILSFLLMQQDVILEGNYSLFSVFIISSIFICAKNQKVE